MLPNVSLATFASRLKYFCAITAPVAICPIIFGVHIWKYMLVYWLDDMLHIQLYLSPYFRFAVVSHRRKFCSLWVSQDIRASLCHIIDKLIYTVGLRTLWTLLPHRKGFSHWTVGSWSERFLHSERLLETLREAIVQWVFNFVWNLFISTVVAFSLLFLSWLFVINFNGRIGFHCAGFLKDLLLVLRCMSLPKYLEV